MRSLLGTMVCSLGLAVGLQAAWQARIQVVVDLPNYGTARPQLVLSEGRMATLRLENVSYGLEAAIDNANRDALRVTVYELSGQERLRIDEVVLQAGGGAVVTQTTPPLALSVVSVTDAQ